MKMTPTQIGKLKGGYVVYWHEQDSSEKWNRKRFRLKAKNKAEALAEGQRKFASQMALRVSELVLEDIWKGYTTHLGERKTAKDLNQIWKHVGPELGQLHPDQINDEIVEEYLKKRANKFRKTHGREPSKTTLFQDVNLLQCVLNHAHAKNIIGNPVKLKKPPRPDRRNRWLKRHEIDQLLEACKQTPHLYIAVLLLLSTAGRVGAVLELEWDRIDLEERTIDLRVPEVPHRKNRAFVPINAGLHEALEKWRPHCDSDFVVEYRGGAVKSIKKAFGEAVKRAGLKGVTPHVLRHTAAVHMAAEGCKMARISQYLGHSSTTVTESIYARFAPEHLTAEADAVDFIKK